MFIFSVECIGCKFFSVKLNIRQCFIHAPGALHVDSTYDGSKMLKFIQVKQWMFFTTIFDFTIKDGGENKAIHRSTWS
jgi:hypothetical protein